MSDKPVTREELDLAMQSFEQMGGMAKYAQMIKGAMEALRENFDALLDAIVKAKPAAAKGQYLKKVAVSSTMGVGVRVDQASVMA